MGTPTYCNPEAIKNMFGSAVPVEKHVVQLTDSRRVQHVLQQCTHVVRVLRRPIESPEQRTQVQRGARGIAGLAIGGAGTIVTGTQKTFGWVILKRVACIQMCSKESPS